MKPVFRTIMFLGHPISFMQKKHDYRNDYGEEITDAMIEYDPHTCSIVVDERASKEYVKYASVFECICNGDYQFLSPETSNPENRAKNIDWLIIAAMPEYDKLKYVEKRIDYYKAMLSRNLKPEQKQSFLQSLTMLVDLQHSLT